MGSSSARHCAAPGPSDETPNDFYREYILGVKLGRGSFAQVHRTTCRKDSEQRAVKIIELGNDVLSTHYCLHEARIWQKVGHHNNCVRMHGIWFDDDLCYMVMEECSAALLPYLQNIAELTERSLGKIFVQMLTGIAHVHSVRIVHRDIKPDNFLIGGIDEGTVKLTDFGLSEALPKRGKLTKVMGTTPFMCPEMLTSKGYGVRADVWSFGVLVYTLFFGRLPYEPAEERNKATMKKAIISGKAPQFSISPLDGCTDCLHSESAVAFVKALLARDPAQRPSASSSLRMPFIEAVVNDSHVDRHNSLASLRPMLEAARLLGVFEEDIDLCAETQTDKLLQMKLPAEQCDSQSFQRERAISSLTSDCSTTFTSFDAPLSDDAHLSDFDALETLENFLAA